MRRPNVIGRGTEVIYWAELPRSKGRVMAKGKVMDESTSLLTMDGRTKIVTQYVVRPLLIYSLIADSGAYGWEVGDMWVPAEQVKHVHDLKAVKKEEK